MNVLPARPKHLHLRLAAEHDDRRGGRQRAYSVCSLLMRWLRRSDPPCLSVREKDIAMRSNGGSDLARAPALQTGEARQDTPHELHAEILVPRRMHRDENTARGASKPSATAS